VNGRDGGESIRDREWTDFGEILSFDIGESGSNIVNVPLYYIHGGISDGINAGPLQETVSFYRSFFL
jgi:hypothetical protein